MLNTIIHLIFTAVMIILFCLCLFMIYLKYIHNEQKHRDRYEQILATYNRNHKKLLKEREKQRKETLKKLKNRVINSTKNGIMNLKRYYNEK